MASVGDLMSERPRQGSGLLMTLHPPSLLVRLSVEVREGGACMGCSSQMILMEGACTLGPWQQRSKYPQDSRSICDSVGAHSLIQRPLLLWLLYAW